MSHTIEVSVTVVTKQVDLVEGELYLYERGAFRSCGQLACLLNHISRGETSHAFEHFNDDGYAASTIHVVRSDP